MTKDKRCWYCGKATMTPKGDCQQCPECGATLTDLPPGDFPPVTREHDAMISSLSSRGRRTGSPSKIVTRRAALARKEKESPLSDLPLKKEK